MKLRNIYLYQIIIVIISAVMICQGIRRFYKREAGQTFLKLAIRILVWGGMAVIVIHPRLTNTFAELIGLKGNINAVILAGFLLIFLIIFKLISAIERIEQQISEV